VSAVHAEAAKARIDIVITVGGECAASGEMVRKVRDVDLVHRRPFLDVGEHRGALHHVVHRGAIGFEHALDVLEYLARFGLNAATHELPGAVGAELAGEVEHAADAHDLGKGSGSGTGRRRVLDGRR